MRSRGAAPLLILPLLLAPAAAKASDHADPALHPPAFQEAGLTGLFAFPDSDRFVIVLTVRRGLSTPGPYEVDRYEYTVFMDLDSRITFDDEEELRRYGGTVENPEDIEADLSIVFRLNDDATPVRGYPGIHGPLTGQGDVKAHTGVHDDPFIFPRFEKKNVVAMVVSIPFSSFPAGRRDWLIWATSSKAGKEKPIDHVGRSNRTQLGRLDFLNTLPPSGHLRAIEKKLVGGQKIQNGLMHLVGHLPALGGISGLFEYVLQVREYDPFPDVMIFSAGRESGFPNGRRLTDDVAARTCEMGDCVLQELAFKEGGYPRRTVNDTPGDAPFPGPFPYLAEAWPEHPEKRTIDPCLLIFWLVMLIAVIAWILTQRRRSKKSEVPVVRRYHPRLVDR